MMITVPSLPGTLQRNDGTSVRDQQVTEFAVLAIMSNKRISLVYFGGVHVSSKNLYVPRRVVSFEQE